MDIEGLKKVLPENRIKTRLIDLVSYASDAGFYHLLPKAIVQPINEKEIIDLFRFSHSSKIPLVFRTGGTSLSGQSITDGILVDLSQHWNKLEMDKDGLKVRVQPGITGGMVNAWLRKFKRKIGPDPSSISAAMMGGIISNNASGMCCGVQLNAYHTTRWIRFILPDGNTFSTENPGDYSRFEKECTAICEVFTKIKNEIGSDPQLYDKIRRKYQTKNTVGYSLNAFVDYKHPMDILAHLLVGAEGTLAFIAEAVLDTVPDYPCKATALLYFKDIYAACKAIIPLKDLGAAMVELMDRASLRAIEHLPGIPDFVKALPDASTALLIEFQEDSREKIETNVNGFLAMSQELFLINPPVFTTDPEEREGLWKIRKGLFPAVGAVRARGTTVILEDVAFPLEKLGDAILDLQELFRKFRYGNAIIFGHAKDGNIHFVVTQSFDSTDEVGRYDRFIREVVTLVVNRYDGALKAEHGTGRNMAPFVETEWGSEAYRIMEQIKSVVDPIGLLNPGVIINKDKNVHIKQLKPLPVVEQEVDTCIECGYCEPVCPSRDLTLTPRRRIVVRRALKQMQTAGDKKNYQTLLKQYDYDGLETCAVDGLCAGACPVDINTGDLVKRLRRENHSQVSNMQALLVAKNFKLVERSVRLALKAGAVVNFIAGKAAMTNLTKGLKKIIPSFPLWTTQIQPPPDLKILKESSYMGNRPAERTIVYFPSCISRVLGSSASGKKNILETFMSIAAKTGIAVKLVNPIQGSCCGQIFSSKGFQEAYRFTANKIIEQLWLATNIGAYPVVMDVSSCTYTLHHLRGALSENNLQKFDRLIIMDSVDYLHDMVMPGCLAGAKKGNIVLHPVCSLQKMGTQKKFVKVAEHFAEEVTVPKQAGCCGMAGDRGFLFPELTQSATFAEAGEVRDSAYDGYYSSTKTCEMAMSEAVQANYESILYLVNESL